MEKRGLLEDFSYDNNHFFATYVKRKDAEDAIKTFFGNLVLDGKKLTIVWAKKSHKNVATGEQGELGQESEAHNPKAKLELPEFSLVPAFDTDLQPVRAPRPPSQPPVDFTDNKTKTLHLMSLLKEGEKKDYAVTQSSNFGGEKKRTKFNLVDY